MLEVKIETGNAAFAELNEGAHAAEILREVADRIEQESKLSEDSRGLKDLNGNTIGFFKTWTEQREEA